jgi:hypothetical protein
MITFYSSVTSNRTPAIIDPTGRPTFLPIPEIPNIVTAIANNANSLCNTTTIASARLSSVGNNVDYTEDLYNIGYQINLLSLSGYSSTVLTRVGQFTYRDILSSYTIYKDNFYDKWTILSNLSIPSLSVIATNGSVNPIGTYGSTITATYI